MVGTFYRAPSPDSDPFIKVGDHVDEGQHLAADLLYTWLDPRISYR